jgi:tRNA-dihydrouridine synthase
VIVGRGCLGRPWLFRELAAAFRGEPLPPAPALGEVWDTMLAHAEALCAFMPEAPAMRAFRKHIGWYTLGFALPGLARPRLMQVQALAELRALAGQIDRGEPFPAAALRAVRGKGAPQAVALPHGYLDDLDDATPPVDEEDGSGG